MTLSKESYPPYTFLLFYNPIEDRVMFVLLYNVIDKVERNKNRIMLIVFMGDLYRRDLNCFLTRLGNEKCFSHYSLHFSLIQVVVYLLLLRFLKSALQIFKKSCVYSVLYKDILIFFGNSKFYTSRKNDQFNNNVFVRLLRASIFSSFHTSHSSSKFIADNLDIFHCYCPIKIAEIQYYHKKIIMCVYSA